MLIQRTACLLILVVLAGCKQLDGTYYPGCAAFEGDKLVLREGRVTWDRFTDQVIVDVDGNPMDPFPDFPKNGRYEVDGDLLHLAFPAENVTKSLHIRRPDERVLLLDAKDLADWESTGRHNDCVLTLAPEETP